MFRNILLPLDGSYFSELALPLAVRVAKAAGAKLHIVRVHLPTQTEIEPSPEWDLDELVRDKEREQLQTAVARATINGVSATAELLEGPVGQGLERYIGVMAIDLVVMTTHGRSGLKRAVLGSVAEHCVRTTNAPLLLLHPQDEEDDVPTHPESLQRILVALDGSPESEQVLGSAMDLAILTGARLTLTRIATAPFDIAVTIGVEALKTYLDQERERALEYLTTVAQRLPGTARIDTFALAADRPAEGILRACKELGANGIAMATHGRSGWSRIAVGSVAESVLRKANVPVLVVRPSTVDAYVAPTAASSS